MNIYCEKKLWYWGLMAIPPRYVWRYCLKQMPCERDHGFQPSAKEQQKAQEATDKDSRREGNR